LAEIYGKNVVHHPAPPFFMIKNPTSIFPKYYINDQFSYPSGHAARAVFLAILVYGLAMKQCVNRTMRKKLLLLVGVLGLYVGFVSISRIYLGHHWLSDIAGGILLGGGTGILALTVLSFRTDG
jgi:undecaprenyl-diphosphatase